MSSSSVERYVGKKRSQPEPNREEFGQRGGRRIKLKISTLPQDSDYPSSTIDCESEDSADIGVVCSQPRSPPLRQDKPCPRPHNQKECQDMEDEGIGDEHGLSKSEREEKIRLLLERNAERRREISKSVFAGLPTLARRNGRLWFRAGSMTEQRKKK